MRRTALLALLAASTLAGLLPAAAVRADVPGPTLVSPVDVAVDAIAVDFRWERVQDATRYRIRVWQDGTGDQPLLDETTVNDRFIASVALAGASATWSVSAIDQAGVEGPPSSAGFTTARVAPELVDPPDGASFDFPDDLPAPSWRHTSYLYESFLVARGDDPLELGDASAQFGPGSWQWQVTGSMPGQPQVEPVGSPIRTLSVTWPGGTPALVAPNDGVVVGADTSFRLDWEPVDGAGLYEWRFGVAGEPPLAASPFLHTRSTWAEVGGFPAGSYTWQVRAIMAGTEYPRYAYGPWSAARTVVVQPPDAVELTSPADGATLDAWPVLRWARTPGAIDYVIQIADSPDPLAQSVHAGDPANGFTFGPPHAGSPFAVTAGAATRWWRVSADLGSAGRTEPSEWRSFSVQAAQPAITSEVAATLLGPADCPSACPDLDGVPILTWTPVPGAASYRVFFRWSGGAGPADSWTDVGSAGLVPHRLFQGTPGSRVAWNVVACPAVGCSSTMPVVRRQFRIGLPAPTLVGPAADIVQPEAAATLEWVPVSLPGAADVLPMLIGYEVESTVTRDGEMLSHAIAGSGAPSSTTREVLWTGATLDWRVRATTTLIAGGTFAGAWSPWRRVTRTEPEVVIVGPSSTGTVDSTPVLDWEALPYAVLGYDVEIARTSLLALWGDGYRSWTRSTGATSMQLPELAPGEYRWRVRRTEAGYHQGEGLGAWSAGWFTVGGDPKVTLVSPAPGDSVRADGAILTWEPFPTVTEYTILIGTTPDLDWASSIYHGYSPTTTHPVLDALPTGQLYWKVCAATDCSQVSELSTGESVVRSMTVTQPPGPDRIAPVTSIKTMTPRLGTALSTTGTIASIVSWTASDDASAIARQDVQLRRGTGAWATIAVSATARTAAVSMTPGAAYSLRVRATDTAGNVSAWATSVVTPILRQENSAMWMWSSGWTRSSSSVASGGAVRWTTRRAATATITVGARSIAIVAPKSTTRGSATIWVDGVRVATVRLDTSPLGSRRIVYSKAWTAVGMHTVVIKVVGTSGHPRIDIDALATLR